MNFLEDAIYFPQLGDIRFTIIDIRVMTRILLLEDSKVAEFSVKCTPVSFGHFFERKSIYDTFSIVLYQNYFVSFHN